MVAVSGGLTMVRGRSRTLRPERRSSLTRPREREVAAAKNREGQREEKSPRDLEVGCTGPDPDGDMASRKRREHDWGRPRTS